ncbi:hypothetical protein Nepgr_005288 [Nepenthes gracilis]|uniref:Uncharacterized protein n=1 Tax=Nepenthes gracilis TaxID=150966 RepID=A0AAD3XG54_NEPGR|nr:hypothetical protein Nepgr_005288 [Nepenthes gracilis]
MLVPTTPVISGHGMESLSPVDLSGSTSNDMLPPLDLKACSPNELMPFGWFGSLSLVLLGTLFWSFSVKVRELLAIGRLSTCYNFTECLDPSDMMAVKCWCCMCSSIVGLCRDVVGCSP